MTNEQAPNHATRPYPKFRYRSMDAIELFRVQALYHLVGGLGFLATCFYVDWSATLFWLWCIVLLLLAGLARIAALLAEICAIMRDTTDSDGP